MNLSQQTPSRKSTSITSASVDDNGSANKRKKSNTDLNGSLMNTPIQQNKKTRKSLDTSTELNANRVGTTPLSELIENTPPNTTTTTNTANANTITPSKRSTLNGGYVIGFSGFRDSLSTEYNSELKNKLLKAIQRLPNSSIFY
jgi:hypothetical protein